MLGYRLNKNINRPQTPFYYYDMELLERTLRTINTLTSGKNYKVHYAIKANANAPILKMIKKHGLGVDCVSGNEIKMAKKLGFNMHDVVFAGVGKSDEEITYALNNDIYCFNSESVEEIEVINDLAKRMNKKTRIALRINPNLDANTHSFLTTGTYENKFGIAVNDIQKIIARYNVWENVKIIGLHFHIGSQITDLEIYKRLSLKVNEIVKYFTDSGFNITDINVGGGLGIDYKTPEENPIPAFEQYFGIFEQYLNTTPEQTVHFELGRSVVGQCGSLVTKVLYIKNGDNKNFAVVDAGMTELIRPALYNSYHKIENISSSTASIIYDVVGPICETSDFFAKEISLPETKRGDVLVVKSVGAYGQVMSSKYNLRNLAKAYYNYGAFDKFNF